MVEMIVMSGFAHGECQWGDANDAQELSNVLQGPEQQEGTPVHQDYGDEDWPVPQSLWHMEKLGFNAMAQQGCHRAGGEGQKFSQGTIRWVSVWVGAGKKNNMHFPVCVQLQTHSKSYDKKQPGWWLNIPKRLTKWMHTNLAFFYPNSRGKFGLLGQEMFHPRAATGDER